MSERKYRIPRVIINGKLLSGRETRTLRLALGSLHLDLQSEGRDVKSLPGASATDSQDLEEHLSNLQRLVSLVGDLDADENR
ncbi:MAG TPA: hypothetical protein VK629_20840 [Steroidobacteraceae bacterium]|nr:hypothetical protein [Steroidobacteraceae bacterium]